MATLEQAAAVGPAIDPMLPHLYRIQRMRNETHDTFTLELAPENGEPGFLFLPGQFNMLYLFGVGEAPLSVSSDPATSPAFRHTIRAVGTVTKAMRLLKRGDTIGLRGPFGSHWPIDTAVDRDVVIVAGGIGLAPLRPAILRLMAQRDKYRRIVLLYGTRTPGDILFERELKRWRGDLDLDIQVTVDRGSSEWRGNVGVVTRLIARSPFDPSTAVAFVCGPEVMMRFAIMELQSRGVAAERVWVSMERNMKCAIGLCGHCQYGPMFICKDGPVFRFDRIAGLFGIPEI